MKQNIIAFGLIASAGLTFGQMPKATTWNLGLSYGTTIEESQILISDKPPYEGNDEDGNAEVIETNP
ncbi:MAG: hypothetical protein O4861_15405 [Trichodesmium sp. St16_bin4-tuft]|nr:hypothetical protein [Trichodesmium sp. St4_bin8_1]MDE5074427.1 hypothetical protein [Trichodesmium sp. St5_bin8]MDE5091554.1 hypothetical protein [Trichodesmium sp. St18_bin3_1_1]MDE5096156.1 hypothetical protein [Trichodesmium sp. St11_bin5]MDE5099637.1 hypothetical protein [Trichodesmium sp. St16_bin4-tuft]